MVLRYLQGLGVGRQQEYLSLFALARPMTGNLASFCSRRGEKASERGWPVGTTQWVEFCQWRSVEKRKEDLDQARTGRRDVIEGRPVRLIHALVRRLPSFFLLTYQHSTRLMHYVQAEGDKRRRKKSREKGLQN